MKKIAIGILLLGVLLFAAACGSESAVNPYVGTWTVNEVLSDGMSIPAKDANIEMTITFNEDGTYVETISGYTHDGEWHETDEGIAKMVSGIEYPMVLNDRDQLVYEMEGAQYCYDKEE